MRSSESALRQHARRSTRVLVVSVVSVVSVHVVGGCVIDAADGPTPDEERQRPAPFVDACLTDPACTEVLLVAHRGEGVAEPENSIAAIRAVAAAGTDIVEVDIRETSDGVPVILHDDTLTRTTNQEVLFPDRASVADFTLAEVKTLTLNDREGRCTPDNDVVDDERCRVPTLLEVLTAAHGEAIIMLDYKGGAIGPIVDDIVAADATRLVLFFDAGEDNLDAVTAIAPEVVTMARASDTDTALDLMARRTPHVLHVDAGYVASLKEASAASGTKLFANIFAEVDFGIIGEELTGNAENLELAADGLAKVVQDGADVLQSNRTPVVRTLLEQP